jgi:nuclear factor NF-kappa-B p105 subunit
LKFAIVFKTPEYWNTAIEKPVQVQLELRRKSDQETSTAIEFTYKPQEFGKKLNYRVSKKVTPLSLVP